MTEIVSGTMRDFKRMVETSMGRPLEASDVAVIKDKQKFFDRVDAIDVGDFLKEMSKFVKDKGITNKDVAVISAEQVASMDKDNKVTDTKGTKLKR